MSVRSRQEPRCIGRSCEQPSEAALREVPGGGPHMPRPGRGSAPRRPPRSGRPRPPCPGGSAWRPRSRPAPAARARASGGPAGRGVLRAPGARGRAAAGVTPGACHWQGRAMTTVGLVRASANDTVRPREQGHATYTASCGPAWHRRPSGTEPPWLQACLESGRPRRAGRGQHLFNVPVSALLVDLQDGVVVLSRGHLGGLLRLPQRLARLRARLALG